MKTSFFGRMLTGSIGASMTGAGFWMVMLSCLFLLITSTISQILPVISYSIPIWIFVGLFGIFLFMWGLKLYFDNISAVGRLFIGLIGIITILFGFILMLGTSMTVIGIFAGLSVIATGYAFIHVGFGIKVIPYLDKLIDSFIRIMGVVSRGR